MNATHPDGRADPPRKQSPMAPIVQELFAGGIMCGVVAVLVAVLHYGTAGHSMPGTLSGRQKGRRRSSVVIL
jgi:hypothetical protein